MKFKYNNTGNVTIYDSENGGEYVVENGYLCVVDYINLNIPMKVNLIRGYNYTNENILDIITKHEELIKCSFLI